MLNSKTFVIDTNILLQNPNAIEILVDDDNTVVIPLAVLEELDHMKTQDRTIAFEARSVVREINSYMDGNVNPIEGIRVGEHGLLKIIMSPNNDDVKNFGLISPTCQDDNIINTAKVYAATHKDEKVTFLTNDVACRIKAIGMGLKSEAFTHDNVPALGDDEIVPKGYIEIPDGWLNRIPSDAIIAKGCGKTAIHSAIISQLLEYLDENIEYCDFLINENDHLAMKFIDMIVITEDNKFLSIDDLDEEPDVDAQWLLFDCKNWKAFMSRTVQGVSPRSFQQAIYFDHMNDSNVDLVIAFGQAGSGKSLIAVASAIEQIKGKKGATKDNLLFVRNGENDTFGNEQVGFLKGTLVQKLLPLAACLTDSLKYIAKHTNNKKLLPAACIQMDEEEALIDDKFIELTTGIFARGRSLEDTILLVDESQNCSTPQVKVLLSRIGENSKAVICGNLAQIDIKSLTPRSSGLSVTANKLHHLKRVAVIILDECERSYLAAKVEELL